MLNTFDVSRDESRAELSQAEETREDYTDSRMMMEESVLPDISAIRLKYRCMMAMALLTILGLWVLVLLCIPALISLL